MEDEEKEAMAYVLAIAFVVAIIAATIDTETK